MAPYLLARGFVGEVLSEVLEIILLDLHGRGLALIVEDFEIAEGPNELLDDAHYVTWSLPKLMMPTMLTRPVQRSPPILILPIDGRSHRHEFPHFCRIRERAG